MAETVPDADIDSVIERLLEGILPPFTLYLSHIILNSSWVSPWKTGSINRNGNSISLHQIARNLCKPAHFTGARSAN